MPMLPLANNHLSVDCVVFGFDGESLKVLLINRNISYDGQLLHDRKLPGSLIYQDEDLDEAASRVLGELTGLRNVGLTQFKAYGSRNRTRHPHDLNWLEQVQNVRVERIVTVAYLAMVKIDRTADRRVKAKGAEWVSIDNVGPLGFDHELILSDALRRMTQVLDADPSILYTLLPKKFTAAQLRQLYELLYRTKTDVRNFAKKILMWDYVVPLEERQQGVAHRAARYYKFDRKAFMRTRR